MSFLRTDYHGGTCTRRWQNSSDEQVEHLSHLQVASVLKQIQSVRSRIRTKFSTAILIFFLLSATSFLCRRRGGKLDTCQDLTAWGWKTAWFSWIFVLRQTLRNIHCQVRFVFRLCNHAQLFVTGMFQRFAFLLHIPFSVPFYFHALFWLVIVGGQK